MHPITLNPNLFINDQLHEVEVQCGLPLRLAYIGLLGVCNDRNEFDHAPRRLKAQILPYDDVNFVGVLAELEGLGLIQPINEGAAYRIDQGVL